MRQKLIVVVGISALFLAAWYSFNHTKRGEVAVASTQPPVNPVKADGQKKLPSVNLVTTEERAPQSVPQEAAAFRTLADLQKSYGPGWDAISEEIHGSKTIRSVLVAKTTEPILNQDNVLDFVHKMRPMFGAPQSEVSLKQQQQPHQFDFVQTHAGYEVYGGRVRVITDPANATPVIINNELKPIENFNDSVVVTMNAAEEVIQRQILAQIEPMTLSSLEKPVAFNTQGNKGELSWVVHAEWIKDRKLFSKDFLVSAVDGKILFERDLIDH